MQIGAVRAAEAARVADGGELVAVGSAEVGDDLVRDMTEVLTGMYARLYCERAGAGRAKPAVAAGAEAADHVAA
jgi:putative resolvase